MRTRILSDLHLEFMTAEARKAFIESVPVDCDVLVLAGDVDAGASLLGTLETFAARFRHVVYVLGNHEFYGTSVTARLDALESWRRPENFHWLENSSVVIDGQRFIGCSLWFPHAPDADTGALNDFLQIRDFVPWVYERNRESVAFLEASVRFNDVVVTHHLPSNLCVHRKYRGDPLNAFFVCDVEHVMRAKMPAVWIHGHTHETVDLVVEQTRIVCNPYGYRGHGTNGLFDPTKTIETPDWPELEAEPEWSGALNKRLLPGTVPAVSARANFYLVVDLEATTSDDGSLPPEQMETIEIGAVLADARTLAVVDEFQSFVRPVRRPRLHPFVTKLTGITQAMVDDAPLFPEAFSKLRAKLIDHRHPLVFASWGRYDRIQLERDCGLHGIQNNMPAHVNLKTMFSEKQGLKKKLGMAQALKLCGLPLEGTHHRGIDDARNIARMLPWIVGERRIGEMQRAAAAQESAAVIGQEDRYKPLLARRVPHDRIVLGRAYVIHARNGGVGVAVEEDGLLGYQLHREKFGDHYLFVEYDWAEDPQFGTAIPLRLIEAEPPTSDEELLAWLANQQEEHRAEIDAAWEVVLGFPPSRLRLSGPHKEDL